MDPVLRFGVFVFFLCLVGCSSTAESLMVPSSTPSPEPSPIATPTIQWFPPTPTLPLRPSPTIMVTPQQKPGIGNILFQDDFRQGGNWSGQAIIDSGSIVLEGNGLTIALNESKVRLQSLYSKIIPSDVYIEITAQTNLCGAGDEYGLLFRIRSQAQLYRFALSCDGKTQIARVIDGNTSFPQPWTISGVVPLGAPSITRLGVWMTGKDLRFFLNDQYQFSVKDNANSGGKIGVYARGISGQDFNVSFSNLIIYEVIP